MCFFEKLQTKHLYQPTQDDFGGLKEIPTTDIFLTSSSGERIHAALFKGSSPYTILFAHGRNRNITRFGDHYALFKRLDLSFLTFDYPGFGQSSGSPSESGAYNAAEAAYSYLTDKLQIAPEKIVVYGVSLGAGVAVEIAFRHPKLRALIVEGAFTSTRGMARSLWPYLPIWPLLVDRYRSIEKVPHVEMPKLFVHAALDERVPLSHSEALFRKAAEPRGLVVVPGAGHKNLVQIGDRTFEGIVKEFVENLSVPVPDRVVTMPVG